MQGLKNAGIPFRITTDLSAALQYDVVLVYPEISDARMTPSEQDDLESFVEFGGTLICPRVNNVMQNVFGYSSMIDIPLANQVCERRRRVSVF